MRSLRPMCLAGSATWIAIRRGSVRGAPTATRSRRGRWRGSGTRRPDRRPVSSVTRSLRAIG
jgi:hypothetical protein